MLPVREFQIQPVLDRFEFLPAVQQCQDPPGPIVQREMIRRKDRHLGQVIEQDDPFPVPAVFAVSPHAQIAAVRKGFRRRAAGIDKERHLRFRPQNSRTMSSRSTPC